MHSTLRSMLFVAVMLAALLLAACGPAPDTEDVSPISSPPASTPAGEATDLPADTPSPVAGGDEEQNTAEIESARGALANLLGVVPQNIDVVSVEQVNWRDSSLGCPEEGQVYTQAIVPGQRVVLQVGDEQYTYHTGNGHVVLCQDEEGTPSAATPEAALNPEIAALVEKAKEDLSDRADVGTENIVLQTVQAMQWRDSSLGCPQPGMQYLQVITPGYLIRLEAGGEVYEYHTDDTNVIYCRNPETSGEGDVNGATELVAAARTDLASVAGVAEDEIEVIESHYVEWADASLGCPKEGQMYAQVITPGYLIRLSAAGQEYEYHTDTRGTVILCQK